MRIIVEVVTLQTLKSFPGSSHPGGVIQDPALLLARTLAQTGSHLLYDFRFTVDKHGTFAVLKKHSTFQRQV